MYVYEYVYVCAIARSSTSNSVGCGSAQKGDDTGAMRKSRITHRPLLISSPIAYARGATIPAVPLTLENPHVGSAESRVAQRVAHRIHSTIDVAKVIKKVP